MFNFFKSKSDTKGGRKEELPTENEGYPDSERPHGLCPRCNKQSSFSITGELPATYDSSISLVKLIDGNRSFYDRVVGMECRNCTQPIIVFEECYIGDTLASQGITSGSLSWKGFFWWPFTSTKSIDHVPDEITFILNEAKTCYSTNCFRASAVMARKSLEAITHDKGETSGNLASRIKNLANNGILDKTLYEWATEIRLIGNSGAHFDIMDHVEKTDAHQILIFIDELLKYLYIMPAELAKRRKVR